MLDIFEELVFIHVALQFFKRVYAGCVLRVITVVSWLQIHLFLSMKLIKSMSESSLRTPISNKSTQLKICLSALNLDVCVCNIMAVFF
jgi:hypothetical protein